MSVVILSVTFSSDFIRKWKPWRGREAWKPVVWAGQRQRIGVRKGENEQKKREKPRRGQRMEGKEGTGNGGRKKQGREARNVGWDERGK